MGGRQDRPFLLQEGSNLQVIKKNYRTRTVTFVYSYMKLLSPFTILVWLAAACGAGGKPKAPDRASVERVMHRYDSLLVRMNTDSIALLFTTDGDLGNVAHGRDSIRKFLARFAAFKVLSQSSTTDSIAIDDDTAVQTGHYQQKTIIPVNDTVAVKGAFKARWILVHDSGWQLKRMETAPQ